MNAQASTTEELVATIDVRDLSGIKWGLMRQIVPKFADDLELGKYLRTLLTSGQYEAVRVVPQLDSENNPSTHVFDVYRIGEKRDPVRSRA